MKSDDTPLSLALGIIRRFDRGWFISRMRELIATPSLGWQVVRELPVGIGDMYGKWLIPGVALCVGFRLARQLLVGPVGVEFLRVKVSIIGTLTHHLVDFALALLFPLVAGLIVERAGRLMGVKFSEQGAFRWVAFALAPIVAVSPLSLLPIIGDLAAGLAVVYMVYVLYVGLQELATSDYAQRGGIFAALLVVLMVTYVVLSNIAHHLRPQQYTVVFGAG